jgi:hypothetical protein
VFVGFDQHQSGRFAQSGAAAAPAPATQGENRPGKRRVHPRYACTGTVEVAPEGSNMPLWCILSDISVSGCYAETTSPLPAHTQVHAVVKTGGIEFHAKGVIRTSHPAVGMGISFSALNPMDKERLESFIEQLRQDLAKGPAPVAQPSAILKPGTVTAKPEAPASQKPVSVRIDSTLMARLTQLRSDLWEMQHSFQPNTLDSRILREVKEAVDHARQSIWFAQQWMELQAEKRDPFPLVDKLNAERLRQSRELNRQLAVDVDAGELAVELQGLEDLYFSIRDLHTRLSKILNKPKA